MSVDFGAFIFNYSNIRMVGTRKNKNKLAESRRGGRLLGKGMYGWAFMPPLACTEFNPSPDDTNRYISKTFINEKKATEEYEKE